VAGVATVSRKNGPRFPELHRTLTLKQYNEALLKSALVMNRIRDGNLMANAQEVGAYFVHRLHEKAISGQTNVVADLRKRMDMRMKEKWEDYREYLFPFRSEAAKINEGNETPDTKKELLADLKTKYDQAFERTRAQNVDYINGQIKNAEKKQLESLPHGLGMLIYGPGAPMDISGAMGRLLPPLTLTREQVDEALGLISK
jgi:4-aminobutyrate aminotransferase-like enzyme